LYFFILSIEIIKKGSLLVGDKVINYLIGLSQFPLKALAVGWLGAGVVQSGGAIGAVSAAMVADGILVFGAAIFVIFGSRIGASITSDLVSLFSKTRNRKDFRHGFEIGVINNIYNIVSILFLFIVEYFTGIFGKIGLFFGDKLEGAVLLKSVPDLVDTIGGWFIDLVIKIKPQFLIVLIGFVILIITLEFFSKSILGMLGGHKEGRKFIHKFMGNRYHAFLIGIGITLLIPSTNITISFLVPLAVARLIKIKEAIPYILGANIGTVAEVVLAAFVTGHPMAIALVAVYVLFTIIAALIWLPNTWLLLRITKEITKHLLKIQRATAIIYVIIFFLIPILLLL
jgi:sodium-dependent phosphate cotransporter